MGTTRCPERNGELGIILSSRGKKEREARAKLHKILSKIICSVSVPHNPNTTTDYVLTELKPIFSLDLGHREAENVFQQIMVTFQQRIWAENPDAPRAIFLLQSLVLMLADQLDMLPIGDSNYVTMINNKETFSEDKVVHMVNTSMELSTHNAPYAVISIVGAQSSGKLLSLYATYIAGKCNPSFMFTA